MWRHAGTGLKPLLSIGGRRLIEKRNHASLLQTLTEEHLLHDCFTFLETKQTKVPIFFPFVTSSKFICKQKKL